MTTLSALLITSLQRLALGRPYCTINYRAETGASGVGSTNERAGTGDGPINIGEPNAL